MTGDIVAGSALEEGRLVMVSVEAGREGSLLNVCEFCGCVDVDAVVVRFVGEDEPESAEFVDFP